MSETNHGTNRSFIVQGISLALALILFSGMLKHGAFGLEWLKFFDFSNLLGNFGSIYEKITFQGKGGAGAREGFLFALTLFPACMAALGFIAVFEHYGALEGARKLLRPILNPLMGIPGTTGLSIMASLQNVDTGAVMTKDLYENKEITLKEKIVFTTFQFSAGGFIVNFFSSGMPLLMLTDASGNSAPVSVGIILAVLIVFKIVGANLMRIAYDIFLSSEEKAILESESKTK